MTLVWGRPRCKKGRWTMELVALSQAARGANWKNSRECVAQRKDVPLRFGPEGALGLASAPGMELYYTWPAASIKLSIKYVRDPDSPQKQPSDCKRQTMFAIFDSIYPPSPLRNRDIRSLELDFMIKRPILAHVAHPK
ncbi:hypothetical protein K470DRAFT_124572 [Piedraia hortae CBS 480.64]|uniref:Uncharacterized protein n=1 Tax=Piedraia hortae CBS 480.64 TaxID=1314780 RepID=A0A6A7C788_9PEZI|nr:hypothetical protein K470DRAFT_124572 [Piedraia hortae CBS 480.64]